jgi:hypothetical protein
MQFANVEIRLAGSLENTVIKEVSVPEIAVLRAVHGHDAVVNIKPSRVEAVDSKVERDRLERAFNPQIVEKLFPGVIAKLPTDLSDVGVDLPEEAPVKKK